MLRVGGNVPTMSNEQDDSASSGFLAKLSQGVSELVRRRAVAALATFVGAYLPDVLDRSQSARDNRENRSLFRRALTEAATHRAVESPELVDRMLDRMVTEEFGRQHRREDIALRAIAHLSDGRFEDAPREGHDTISDQDIGDDWLNLYSRYSQEASSDALQDTWARVLAGQIRKPGSISLKTLHFVSLLDKETAEAASRLLPWLVMKTWLFAGVTQKLSMGDRVLLRESGLIGALEHDLDITQSIPDEGTWFASMGHLGVIGMGEPGSKFTLPMVSTSRACRELGTVVVGEDTAVPAMALAERMQQEAAFKRIQVGPYQLTGGRFTQSGATLIHRWDRPG